MHGKLVFLLCSIKAHVITGLIVCRSKDVFVCFVCSFHALEEWRVCREHDFDRLKRSFGCLRIERVHDWYPEQIQSSEQEVCSALVYTLAYINRYGEQSSPAAART